MFLVTYLNYVYKKIWWFFLDFNWILIIEKIYIHFVNVEIVDFVL
jgi:hypothetical protein